MKDSSSLKKYLRYFLVLGNLILVLDAYSEITKETNNKSLKWEILEKEYNKKQENYLRWEIVPKEENVFDILEKTKKNFKNSFNRTNYENIYQISPTIPLNNFIKKNNIESAVEWKSSFGGGKSGGTGQQNNSFNINYGLNNFTQISGYFAEADDETYNFIKGKNAHYSLQTYAFSLKKKIWDSENYNHRISFLSSIEYLRISSGSATTKSIFNEINDSVGKDKFGKTIFSVALPFTKIINKKISYTFVPGYIYLPSKLGDRTNKDNFYGGNFYIGSGITFNLLKNLTLLGSITNPLGPGDNYFDKDLNFRRKPIYSFGMNWDINKRINIETKITNGFGSTPATGLFTLPSDNLTLYAANVKYKPNEEDTPLKPLDKIDKLMSHGGITVNNALIPKNGTSQYNLNLNSKGGYSSTYSYSLSNIFQLELINIESIVSVQNRNYINKKFTDTFIDTNNFNMRIGGKFLIFTPQKNDILWTSFRTSLGRNESTNQGYIFSELINTFRINNYIATNLSTKYFISGIEKFGAIGASIYIKLSDKFQIIPELNHLWTHNLQSNYTVSLRYSLTDNKSIDLYSSNAIGSHDLGQILRSKDNKIGIKLNLFY
tara:strand:- start:2936 stop:4747 length:1812 start_codon:yes stop_codon:yes gene_type:complete